MAHTFLRKLITTSSPNTLGKASSVVGTRFFSTNFVLMSDSQSKEYLEEKVVMTDDGRVVVCWHPEVPIPYEHTRPIPMEVLPTDSVLKIQSLVPTREIFRGKYEKMIIRELMSMTYTAKAGWYPKRRRTRYMEAHPGHEKRDREYL